MTDVQLVGKKFLIRVPAVLFVWACVLFSGSGVAQSSDAAIAATKKQVVALRDAFVKATVTAGFTCPITPPTIVIEDVPSYGNYDEDTNTLKSSAWELLTDEEKAVFYRLTGPNGTEDAARKEFETGAHHWVLVLRGLGHQAVLIPPQYIKPPAFAGAGSTSSAARTMRSEPVLGPARGRTRGARRSARR